MVGNRRRSRESALQVLYQDEFHTPATRVAAERYFWEDAEEAPSRAGQRDFARYMVDGVRSHLTAIDDRIRAVARNWKIERMSRVDRNILRLATFELLFASDIPPKVALNEAIEIAKVYGTEDSGAFINGILDRISRERPRPGDASAAPPHGGEGNSGAAGEPVPGPEPSPAPQPPVPQPPVPQPPEDGGDRG